MFAGAGEGVEVGGGAGLMGEREWFSLELGIGMDKGERRRPYIGLGSNNFHGLERGLMEHSVGDGS